MNSGKRVAYPKSLGDYVTLKFFRQPILFHTEDWLSNHLLFRALSLFLRSKSEEEYFCRPSISAPSLFLAIPLWEGGVELHDPLLSSRVSTPVMYPATFKGAACPPLTTTI